MKIAFAVLLVVHAAIHLAGFAKAYGLAELPQLAQPISRGAGALWLGAGLLFLATAGLWVGASRHWWIAAAPAVVLSQALILADFHDAKLGTVANAIILVPLLLSLADLRPSSLRALYEADVRRQTDLVASAGRPSPPVTEADLTQLPAAVATYLRRTGVVGKPRPRSLEAVFHARMRNSPQAAWMKADVEQHNFYGPAGPMRLFFMTASRWGIPFVGYHRYAGDTATMRIRLLGLVEIVDVHGPEMTQSETVTMLNDMFFLAPAALIDAGVRWETLADGRVKATYSNAGHTVSALVSFDAAGDLVGFVSGDRYQSDGKTHKLYPWSTPIGDYQDFGGVRLARRGEAHWIEPSGEWTYGEFLTQRVSYR